VIGLGLALLWAPAVGVGLAVSPFTGAADDGWWSGAYGPALGRSLRVALGVAGVAALVGLPAGLLAGLYDFPLRRSLLLTLALPLLLPSFLGAIGLSRLRIALHLPPDSALSGYVGVVWAFATFVVPLVLFITVAAARNISRSQQDAARLAGGERHVLWHSARQVGPVAVLTALLGSALTLSDPGPGQILGHRGAASEILVTFAAQYDFALAARQCLTLAGVVLAVSLPVILLLAPRLATGLLARDLAPAPLHELRRGAYAPSRVPRRRDAPPNPQGRSIRWRAGKLEKNAEPGNGNLAASSKQPRNSDAGNEGRGRPAAPAEARVLPLIAPWLASGALGLLVAALLALPVLGFFSSLGDAPPWGEAWQRVGQTFGNTLVYGLGAGVIAAGLGGVLALAAGRFAGPRIFLLAGLLVALALPPALSALGFIQLATVAPSAWDPLLRGRGIVSLSLGLRLTPIAALFVLRSLGAMSPSWARAAALHGVSLPLYLARVLLPWIRGALLAAALLIALLAVADVGTTLLLHPPGSASLPLTIFTVMANAPESLVSLLCLFYLGGAALLLGGGAALAERLVRAP
jgi:ABC-type Fe3+ transport system permease subunit